MKDRKNESLSALCDGECDELEVRRVLNQFSSDPELREQWRSYHLLGAILRDEVISNVDLSEGIMQALDGRPMDDVPALAAQQGLAKSHVMSAPSVSSSAKNNVSQWLVSGAVAASVTLAVLVGARFIHEPVVGNGAMMTQTSVEVSDVMETAPVIASNTEMTLATAAAVTSPEELRKAQEVLNQYLLEHENEVINASEQSLAPYVRVANFGADNKPVIRKD